MFALSIPFNSSPLFQLERILLNSILITPKFLLKLDMGSNLEDAFTMPSKLCYESYSSVLRESSLELNYSLLCYRLTLFALEVFDDSINLRNEMIVRRQKCTYS